MRRRALMIAIAGACCVPAAAHAIQPNSHGQVQPMRARIDSLRATVRDQVTRVEVTETEGQRVAAVPSDVLFSFDRAVVSPAGLAALRSVASEIVEGSVTVVGHTDARGSTSYNEELSRRRAAAVARVLTSATDDPAVRFVARGAGEREPVASNAKAGGRARNRRVEVRLPRG